MSHLSFHYGQPVYKLEAHGIRITVTIQNACVMPYYQVSDDKEICPYWLAPWWNDKLYDDGSTISSTLRGNFFCMEPEEGSKYEHGLCANSPWDLQHVEVREDSSEMVLQFQDPEAGGFIEKTLSIYAGDSAIYETDKMYGFEGRYSYNTHPCLKVPKACFAGQIKGTFHSAVTAADIFSSETGAYRRLGISQQIEDMSCVTTIYGEKTDLTRHPQYKGTIDLLLSRTDAENRIGYEVFINPEGGYCYYQLKDTSVLPYTMFWMFNGGRHFAPWNGTVDGCLGVEEMSGPVCIFDRDFPKVSQSHGIQMEKDKPVAVKQIYGAVELPEHFTSIEKLTLEKEGLRVCSDTGIELLIPIRLSYFAK